MRVDKVTDISKVSYLGRAWGSRLLHIIIGNGIGRDGDFWSTTACNRAMKAVGDHVAPEFLSRHSRCARCGNIETFRAVAQATLDRQREAERERVTKREQQRQQQEKLRQALQDARDRLIQILWDHDITVRQDRGMDLVVEMGGHLYVLRLVSIATEAEGA